MEAGAGLPGQVLAILRVRNAGLSSREKSLVLASCRKCLKFEEASANMRRFFWSRGGGSQQDALFTGEAADSHASDEDLDALAAYRGEKRGASKKKKDGSPKRGGDEAKRGGQRLNGFNRKTGLRSRSYWSESEYHLAPRCPWRDTPRGDGSSFPQGLDRAREPPFSSVSMETPVFRSF